MNSRYFMILLLLAALLGASFLFMRIAAPLIGPVWLIELRVLFAGLFLLPIVVLQGRVFALWHDAKGLFITGGLTSALPFTLLAYASVVLSAGLTSILNATVPIFAVLFAWLVVKEQFSMLRVAGVVLGFIGVMVLVGWQEGMMTTPSWLSIAAILLAAISYVYGTHYTRVSLSHMTPMVYAAGSQLAAAILLLPLLPFFLPESPVQELLQNTPLLWSVFGLAIPSTALPFWLYFYLVHRIGTTQTLTVTYLIPLFAVVWGYWFLDEALTAGMIAGGGLILLGTAVANGYKTA